MKILGYDYKVIRDKARKDLPEKNSCGLCNPAKLTIHIGKDMHRQQVASTVLHEIIEAISVHLGIGLKERQVECLESGLYQTLKDAGVNIDKLANTN